MALLELRLLGGYEGTLASGAALSLPTRKAWALLAYLALHPGREISREQLAALLWGERFAEQARASLRQTLYELRGALGAGLTDRLIANRDTVTWGGDDIEVDVLRLEALARRRDAPGLARIAPLYRGALLAGLETGEAEFDDWLTRERARLHELACEALERFAAVSLAENRSGVAIATLQDLIRLDPLREKPHRLLMQGLTTVGRRSEALKQYRDLARLLKAELGVAPDPETTRLRDELLRNNAVLGAGPSVEEPEHVPAPRSAEPGALEAGRTNRSWLALAAVAICTLAIALAGSWIFRAGGLRRTAEVVRDADLPGAVRDKPAIAVLPFANLSSDPGQEHFADGLTEDLITALSRTSQLLVIARTSVAGYKDKPVKARSIANDLGIRYLLEGGVQKSGSDLRVTAQLIDASNGHHLWSERYDRKATEVFAVQDDIVRRVLVELQVELTDGEHARIASRGTTNLDAWLLRLQAVGELYKFTRESTVRTRELLQAAHDLDPQWGRPLAGIAWSYWWEARRGWTDDRAAWIRKGIAYAERAIEMNPDDTLGYMQLGNLVQLQGDHERAINLRERAVEIAPNDFQANWGLGAVLFRAGEAERGVEVLRHALKLCPRPPASLLWTLSQAQLIAGRYEAAIEAATRASELAPERDIPHVQLVAAFSALGRMEEARAEAAEVLRTDPSFSVSAFKRDLGDYKDQASVETLANLLSKAGLPEQSEANRAAVRVGGGAAGRREQSGAPP